MPQLNSVSWSALNDYGGKTQLISQQLFNDDEKNNITLLMLFLITTPLLAYAEYFNLEALDNIENINDIENIILNLDNQPEGFMPLMLLSTMLDYLLKM